MPYTLQDNSSVPPDPEPDHVPGYPSYVYAKIGELPTEEPTPVAHLERNQWQTCLAPPTLPDTLPYHDPQTGLTWTADAVLGEVLYHGAQDCIRAVIDGERLDALRSDPDYRQAVADLGGSYNVDELIPSAQVCYSTDTGQPSTGGSIVGSWDFASPDVPDQTFAHIELDMLPDHRDDRYVSVPMATNDADCNKYLIGDGSRVDSGGAWDSNGALDGGGSSGGWDGGGGGGGGGGWDGGGGGGGGSGGASD